MALESTKLPLIIKKQLKSYRHDNNYFYKDWSVAVPGALAAALSTCEQYLLLTSVLQSLKKKIE